MFLAVNMSIDHEVLRKLVFLFNLRSKSAAHFPCTRAADVPNFDLNLKLKSDTFRSQFEVEI